MTDDPTCYLFGHSFLFMWFGSCLLFLTFLIWSLLPGLLTPHAHDSLQHSPETHFPNFFFFKRWFPALNMYTLPDPPMKL